MKKKGCRTYALLLASAQILSVERMELPIGVVAEMLDAQGSLFLMWVSVKSGVLHLPRKDRRPSSCYMPFGSLCLDSRASLVSFKPPSHVHIFSGM